MIVKRKDRKRLKNLLTGGAQIHEFFVTRYELYNSTTVLLQPLPSFRSSKNCKLICRHGNIVVAAYSGRNPSTQGDLILILDLNFIRMRGLDN